jgi:hypothetical protein
MTDQPRSGLTSDEDRVVALEPQELRDAVAFLMLNVTNEPATAMELFLRWCVAHDDEVRAGASAHHLDQA